MPFVLGDPLPSMKSSALGRDMRAGSAPSQFLPFTGETLESLIFGSWEVAVSTDTNINRPLLLE